MPLKRIRHNSGEGIIKIKIEEDSGALLEKWTIMMSDLGNWYHIMKKKYGDRVNSKSNRDRDLDWIS